MASGQFDKPDFRKSLRKAFDSHDVAALMHVSPLAQQLLDNPDEAIPLIRQTYEQGLDQAYTGDDGVNMRAFIQTTAGGPHEAVPRAIYNSVGEAYPYLNRQQKDSALAQVLMCLDGINTAYIQITHTPGIREPLLLSDICACRPPYWPGIDEGIRHIQAHETFEDLKNKIINKDGTFKRDQVISDFLVAYALLHSKYSPWGEEYVASANQGFLERTLKGVVGLYFSGRSPETVEEEIQVFHNFFPSSIHNRVRPLVEEADWVDKTNFP